MNINFFALKINIYLKVYLVKASCEVPPPWTGSPSQLPEKGAEFAEVQHIQKLLSKKMLSSTSTKNKTNIQTQQIRQIWLHNPAAEKLLHAKGELVDLLGVFCVWARRLLFGSQGAASSFHGSTGRSGGSILLSFPFCVVVIDARFLCLTREGGVRGVACKKGLVKNRLDSGERWGRGASQHDPRLKKKGRN